jgi:probable phosphoglycerate mutase
MLDPVPFYFIRHGETDWNRLRLMQGQTDTPLNDNGVLQAHAAGQSLAGLTIGTICASPLRRARETAEIIARYLPAPIIPMAGLMECNFGIYEGHPGVGPWFEDWKRGADLPEGESITTFAARTLLAINQALQHAGPVLVVAHGGNFLSIRDAVLDPSHPLVGNCEPLALSPPQNAETQLWALTRVSNGAQKSGIK